MKMFGFCLLCFCAFQCADCTDFNNEHLEKKELSTYKKQRMKEIPPRLLNTVESHRNLVCSDVELNPNANEFVPQNTFEAARPSLLKLFDGNGNEVTLQFDGVKGWALNFNTLNHYGYENGELQFCLKGKFKVKDHVVTETSGVFFKYEALESKLNHASCFTNIERYQFDVNALETSKVKPYKTPSNAFNNKRIFVTKTLDEAHGTEQMVRKHNGKQKKHPNMKMKKVCAPNEKSRCDKKRTELKNRKKLGVEHFQMDKQPREQKPVLKEIPCASSNVDKSQNPPLREPICSVDERFLMNGELENEAECRVSSTSQKKTLLEPTPLNLTDELAFSQDNTEMEAQVREKCKVMNKKQLQEWLKNVSKIDSKKWLCANNEQLSNRICTHVLKNRENRKAEEIKDVQSDNMEKLHEKQAEILKDYQLDCECRYLLHGFPWLVENMRKLKENVQLEWTDDAVSSQAFESEKKYFYNLNEIPQAIIVGGRRADLILFYENYVIFGNAPFFEKERIQIHYIFLGKTINTKIEVVRGTPFKIVCYFYINGRGGFKYLSPEEVSEINFSNKGINMSV